jgi:hypothetical protein
MEDKQTLEEVADNSLYSKEYLNQDERSIFKKGCVYGAKWQQERSYSKTDIENIWNEFVKELPPINNGAASDFLVYLKQFKKK